MNTAYESTVLCIHTCQPGAIESIANFQHIEYKRGIDACDGGDDYAPPMICVYTAILGLNVHRKIIYSGAELEAILSSMSQLVKV